MQQTLLKKKKKKTDGDESYDPGIRPIGANPCHLVDPSKKLHALYRGDYDDSLALPLNHSDLDAACVVEKVRGRGEKKLDCTEGKAKVDIAPAMTRTDRFAR